ncbi:MULTISPECIES: DUF6953 family protein [unclassified Rhodococcus (in: high G+C Gram-positive bacteria)]|uniref:DUF6953 family protein n=1 Tax=Rhodococcus sp. SJ-3 TaxID=3454628 RepID=UPI002DAAAA98|nr:hypothetical protein [Rhodococcus sp. (in: high G+C Gram-positive bacteria)]
MSTSASDIATWMIDIINTERRVGQADMVDAIESKFGSEWIYVGDSGHPSVDRTVLKEFRKAHRGAVKWHREDLAWYIDDKPETGAAESSAAQ